MGVLQDQIAAIRNDGALSDDEKRRQINAVKANGLRDYIGFIEQQGQNRVARYLGKPFTFNGFIVTVWAVGVSDQNSLVVDMTRTRESDNYTEQKTFYIMNPPVLDSTGNENLLQVVGEMLTSFPFSGGG